MNTATNDNSTLTIATMPGYDPYLDQLIDAMVAANAKRRAASSKRESLIAMRGFALAFDAVNVQLKLTQIPTISILVAHSLTKW